MTMETRLPAKASEIAARLKAFRQEMPVNGVEAYLFYGTDPHQSEHPAPRWRDREWITGFTGSAGTVAVTADNAALWTDGRYTVQARAELQHSGIELFQIGAAESTSPTDFLKKHLDRGCKVGLDGSAVSVETVRKLREKLDNKEISVDPDCDLPNILWKDRPDIPDNTIKSLPIEYSGRSRQQKLDSLRKELRSKGANHYLESSLDCIAWILNIRGNDIAFSPLAIAHLLIGEAEAILFIDDKKVPAEIRAGLAGDGVAVSPYEAIEQHLQKLPSEAKVAYDPKKTAFKLCENIPDNCDKVEVPNLAEKLKAVKNDCEIANLKQVMLCDSVAQCKFFCWLDENVDKRVLTEIDAAQKAREFRAQQPDFMDESFRPIPGYMEHGALPHYAPTPENQSKLQPQGFFLLDSGGQYLGGTTDITRTVALGPLTDQMKRDYTLVLKGLINISRHRFMTDRNGSHLDILARTPLWEHGLDYKHGTGHGIGSYLNVHEGPCGLSPMNTAKLEPGMILATEPGLYREGAYGIRLENMQLIVEDEETEFGKFYRFETLTLVPFDLNAIEPSLLSKDDTEWLNAYHEHVFSTLAEKLQEREREWLRKKTEPIS